MASYKRAVLLPAMVAGGAVTMTVMAILTPRAADQDQDPRAVPLARYKQAYDKWVDFCSRREVMLSSSTEVYDRAPASRNLVDFGAAVLPYIFDRHQRDVAGGRRLWPLGVVGRILQRRFLDVTPEEWWAEGAGGARRRFDAAYARWKQVKTGNDMPLWSLEYTYNEPSKWVGIRRVQLTPAGEVYLALKDLGIETLPFIVEKLQQGDYDLLPLALELTDQTPWAPTIGNPEASAKWFLDWWAEHKQDWLIPWPDQ